MPRLVSLNVRLPNIQVTDLFRLIDNDGNQRLQKEELKEYVAGLSGKLKDHAVDDFMEQLEEDGDGWVSVREWLSRLCVMCDA